MPIINEIDEDNKKNNRTIDTETGIYLTVNAHDIRDHMYQFSLFEKEKKIIELWSTVSWKIDDENKIISNQHYIGGATFYTAGAEKKYISIITKILEEHGRGFKAAERRGKYKELTSVIFVKDTDSLINAWEANNG